MRHAINRHPGPALLFFVFAFCAPFFAFATSFPPQGGGGGGGAATSLDAAAYPLLAPDGTSGAPSYSFTNDSDTGAYSSGTNSYTIATASAAQLTVNASRVSCEGNILNLYVREISNVTASGTLGASNANSGYVYTNSGATSKPTITLRDAPTVGYTAVFIVQDSDGLIVAANTGDTIRVGTSVTASAGNVDSTTVGSTITLVAISATEWYATSVVGTWTVN